MDTPVSWSELIHYNTSILEYAFRFLPTKLAIINSFVLLLLSRRNGDIQALEYSIPLWRDKVRDREPGFRHPLLALHIVAVLERWQVYSMQSGSEVV